MGKYDEQVKPVSDSSKLIDLQFIAALAATSLGPRVLDGIRPYVLLPQADGRVKLETLPLEHEAPLLDHIRQDVSLTELESFVNYIKQFKTHTAQIFAVVNDSGAQFEAVLDYHEGGQEAKPGRGAHAAGYSPQYSPEFSAWLGIQGKGLTQEQFLDHLRKWGDTITTLSDADLIEIASSLDFTSAGEFSSHVERTNGGRKLLFNERVEGSAQVKGKTIPVPDRFTLDLPVFTGGRKYQIGVDLLYRPQNGALRIISELRRQHLVVRQAVKDIVADVKEGTGIEPFLGRLNA